MADEQDDSPRPQQPPKIIIVKRRSGGHGGGHHGGAWKVAYADFVTAMMALFIVLWLLSADKEVQESVSAYFNNPSGPGKQTGTAAAGAGNSLEIPKEDMKSLQDKIQQALMTVPNFRNLKDHVEITITSDGLRIELVETEAGIFFESGRPVPSSTGTELLTRLAEELGKLQNGILIEGHTDAKPFAGDGSYTNWELSSDRANSARRLMQNHGIRPEQVQGVRGYADRAMRHPEDPTSAANRRISVIVQYLSGQAAKEDIAKQDAAKGAGHGAAPEGGHGAPAPGGHGAAEKPAEKTAPKPPEAPKH